MASQELTIGTTPTNLREALAALTGTAVTLTDSDRYTVQNQGQGNVKITEVATSEDDPVFASSGPVIAPLESWGFEKESDVDVWVWAITGENLICVVES